MVAVLLLWRLRSVILIHLLLHPLADLVALVAERGVVDRWLVK